jgi:hypothetical protein
LKGRFATGVISEEEKLLRRRIKAYGKSEVIVVDLPKKIAVESGSSVGISGGHVRTGFGSYRAMPTNKESFRN